MHQVVIGGKDVAQVTLRNDAPLSLICGPCAIESRDMALKSAVTIRDICDRVGVGLVYKSSFDKANRSSLEGKRGVGMEEGLDILAEIRREIRVPVLTDIHNAQQAAPVGEVVDVLQIPAFLCRQTDILMAAAATGKVVNVKKGQFLSPYDVPNIVEKLESSNNRNILLTERGTTFGYGNLVSDMRSLRIMAETGYPIVFDATHSVQMPGGQGKSSGGKREFVEPLARAAVAVGVAGVFIEAHPNPACAISDGPNQVPLDQLEGLLRNLKAIDDVAKEAAYREIA